MIVKTSPVGTPDSIAGNNRRQDLFLTALSRISGEIEIAWFERGEVIEATGPLAPREAALSSTWGVPIRLSPITVRGRRPKTFWTHYGTGALSAWGQEDFYYSSGPDQAAQVARLLNRNPDLVFVSRLMAMGAVLRAGIRPPRLFFDLDDIEHKKVIRVMREPPLAAGKLLYATHALQLMRAERRAARVAVATFVCSDQDRQYLQRHGMDCRIEVIPNGLPVPPVPAPPCPEPTILFLGNYSYHANASAAERLITRILPLVQRQLSGARAIVAGNHADRIPSYAAVPDGVEFCGFVEDLPALYARSRVVACPVTTGSGTRIKLLEGAAYGRPMVSTRLGAEGLSFQNGRDLLLHDDDAGFAAACAGLLQDDAACARLGAAARVQMQADYADTGIVDRIAGIMSGNRSASLAA